MSARRSSPQGNGSESSWTSQRAKMMALCRASPTSTARRIMGYSSASPRSGRTHGHIEIIVGSETSQITHTLSDFYRGLFSYHRAIRSSRSKTEEAWLLRQTHPSQASPKCLGKVRALLPSPNRNRAEQRRKEKRR